ncbi:MAG: diacylglycerol kinase family lipid kinase [Muribaculaceae bacterium]|nr:diacylglycerol kinase family lipid kinase [Muribaculaceae bacterium]
MARLMLIINPISGTGSKKGVVEMVEQAMGACGHDVDVRLTGARGDATRLAGEAAAKGYHGVLACGGDGTVNETARALCGTETALGILPAGSGNGLARHLQIPVDIAMALKVIADGNVVDSAYGTVNGRPFFCTFGMGFDAAVSHRFARQSRRGILSYVKSAISEYVQYRPQTYTVSANGKLLTEKAFLIAVCNASQWGNNAYIAPEASITDGLLDITIVHSGTAIDAAVMGMDIFTGYINKNTMVHTFRAPACVIYRNGAGEAHIDGEPMMMDDILDVKCHHGALKVFTPGATHRFTPVITPLQEMFKGARLSIKHLLGSR